MPEIKMSTAMIQAAYHCLNSTDPKGKRTELRSHSRCRKALSQYCVEKKVRYVPMGQGQPDRKMESEEPIDNSVLHLDQERAEYLKDAAEDRLDAGIPGTMSEGYDDLLEALDSMDQDKAEEKNEIAEAKKKAV
jgi:hypothetical protein